MTELSAKQLYDLMSPLWERTLDLSPNGLAQSRGGYFFYGLHRISDEADTQLCESSMVRWLANNGLAPGIAEDVHHTPYENRFSVCLNTPSLGIFWASTLVEALAAACNARLDAKQSEVTRD